MSTAVANELSITFVDVPLENDYDTKKAVAFVPRETSVRKIIDGLRLSHHDRRTSTKKPSRYKDSGEWGMYRGDDGAINISVDVGCFCSHDCCGHLCSLRYTLQKVDGRILILSTSHYNY